MFSIAYGAISRFNYDDIKFYYDKTPDYLFNYNIYDMKARVMRIERYFVASVQWVMSPTTINKIESIMKGKKTS